MTIPPPPSEEELHAFIDEELSPLRHQQVAAALHADAVLAARVAAYRADQNLLRDALDSIAGEALPSAWAARIEAGLADRKPMVARRWMAIAAGIALAVCAGAAVRGRWPGRDTILAEAEAAREGRLDGRIAAGDPLPPPDARDALLRSALAMPMHVPDLHRFDFRLVHMALYRRPGGGGGAQLAYVDRNGQMLTIYVRPSDGKVQFDILRHGQTRVCVWQDDVVGAVIMAKVSAAEMLRIASTAYTSLNL